MMFALGVITGLLFAVIAVMTGKKFEVAINHPDATILPMQDVIRPRQAKIIKSSDDIEDFLNG